MPARTCCAIGWTNRTGSCAGRTRPGTPLLDWAADRSGARLMLAGGIVFVQQPAEALEAIAGAVARFDAISLAALNASPP